MEPKIKIDGNKFYGRLEKIHKLWKMQNSSITNADILIFLRGNFNESEEAIQTKTSLLHTYLLGYEFTDTLICFTNEKVIFFLFRKKKLLIEASTQPSNYNGPKIELIERNSKGNNDESIQQIFEMIKKENNQAKVATLKKEPGVGLIVDEYKTLLKKFSEYPEIIDSSNFIDDILSLKDSEEIENIQIASKYSCHIMEYVIKMFENAIDQEIPTSHQKIANDIKNYTEKTAFITKFKEKEKLQNLEPSLLEIGSLPVIQSGGNYFVDPFGVSTSKKLSSDVIICKVNSRYKDYNSLLIRSFMIDAQNSQQTKYKILYEAFNFLVSKLVEGNILGKIYQETIDFITEKDQQLLQSLPENFGFSIGLDVNNSVQIKKGSNKKITSGMVFFVMLSFEGLKNEKDFKYTLQIGDTVLVKPQIFTNSISKLLTEINYDMEDDEENNNNGIEKHDIDYDTNVRLTRNQINKLKNAEYENKRSEHQKELLTIKISELNEEIKMSDTLKHRFDKNVEKVEDLQYNKKMMKQIRSYPTSSHFPRDLVMGKIYVDMKSDSLILPIGKTMVPFHASLIKSVSKSEISPFSFLRINFHIPLTGLNNLAYNDFKLNTPTFVKELSFKSRDAKNYSYLFKTIKDLIKKVKVKEKEEKERSEVVASENLILLKGKKIQLHDVIIRPNISTKRTNGVLEAHSNGFRYTSNKSESVDIIYRNIKHAFYQPCENELVVLLHFHLKNPIMIGKKKSSDVQFLREAGIQTDDLDIKRRGNDYEEYENELREYQNKQKINEEFHKFTLNVEELKTISFDMPFRDLIFNGVPNKSNVQLIPTVNCLVSLIEPPFYITTLTEIELIYFERVSHSIKNFDMAIIFKDWNKPVQRITAIPIENLEMIKNWLDETDILFFEGLYNMNWQKVFESIKKNPLEWVEDGGWECLKAESSGHNSDSELEGDSEFTESKVEEEEEDESEFSEASDYSDSDVEEEDLSDEGLSWGEMEKKMANEDREALKRNEEEMNGKSSMQNRKQRR